MQLGCKTENQPSATPEGMFFGGLLMGFQILFDDGRVARFRCHHCLA